MQSLGSVFGETSDTAAHILGNQRPNSRIHTETPLFTFPRQLVVAQGRLIRRNGHAIFHLSSGKKTRLFVLFAMATATTAGNAHSGNMFSIGSHSHVRLYTDDLKQQQNADISRPDGSPATDEKQSESSRTFFSISIPNVRAAHSIRWCLENT